MTSKTYLTSCGTVKDVQLSRSANFQAVGTLLYDPSIAAAGLELQGASFAANAASGGLDVQLQDKAGRVIIGPLRSYGGSGVFQPIKFSPAQVAAAKSAFTGSRVEAFTVMAKTIGGDSQMGQFQLIFGPSSTEAAEQNEE